MPSTISEDKGKVLPPTPEPDAHGQAAMILVESLIHVLVEKALLTNDEAVNVIETASQIKHEVAVAAGESFGRMQASLDLLTKVEVSFRAALIKMYPES